MNHHVAMNTREEQQQTERLSTADAPHFYREIIMRSKISKSNKCSSPALSAIRYHSTAAFDRLWHSIVNRAHSRKRPCRSAFLDCEMQNGDKLSQHPRTRSQHCCLSA